MPTCSAPTAAGAPCGLPADHPGDHQPSTGTQIIQLTLTGPAVTFELLERLMDVVNDAGRLALAATTRGGDDTDDLPGPAPKDTTPRSVLRTDSPEARRPLLDALAAEARARGLTADAEGAPDASDPRMVLRAACAVCDAGAAGPAHAALAQLEARVHDAAQRLALAGYLQQEIRATRVGYDRCHGGCGRWAGGACSCGWVEANAALSDLESELDALLWPADVSQFVVDELPPAPAAAPALTNEERARLAAFVADAHPGVRPVGWLLRRLLATPIAPTDVQAAVHAIVAALYFTDSADYLRALWTALRALDPRMADLVERDPAEAFRASVARIGAEGANSSGG